MHATLLTAATDILVIAGVAAMATAALNCKDAPFKVSLGVEYDDNSLVATETDDAIGTLRKLQPALSKPVDGNQKTLSVDVDMAAVMPPLVEIQASDLIAHAKAI